MARSIDYNDENLQRLFAELEPKRRLQAIKGGFRREANQVRKTAINNLRSAIQSDKDLEKGVRAIVFKRKAGFRVTVGTKRAGVSIPRSKSCLGRDSNVWCSRGVFSKNQELFP